MALFDIMTTFLDMSTLFWLMIKCGNCDSIGTSHNELKLPNYSGSYVSLPLPLSTYFILCGNSTSICYWFASMCTQPQSFYTHQQRGGLTSLCGIYASSDANMCSLSYTMEFILHVITPLHFLS